MHDRDIPPPPGSSPASKRSNALFYRLAEHQIKRPYAFLGAALVLVVLSLALASRLAIKPGFEAMLPQDRPSVIELERVKKHTTGVSTVFVVLEGDDTAVMRKAADDIVVEVLKIGRPYVGSAESGVHEALTFLQPHSGMYAEFDKLQALYDKIEERWLWEVGKAAGTLLDEDDDYVPPEISVDTLKKDFGVEEASIERYPDGYYQSKDGKTVIVAIRSGVLGTNYAEGNEAIRLIREAVERIDPSSRHASIKWDLSGDLVTSISEYTAIGQDLMDVGLLGGGLIISVVFLYYLRLRTLWSMLLTIGIGVSVCFAFAQLVVGHLTMATGFLFSIIAGNGINPGIIYMARFLEARRKYVDCAGAIRLAHRDTWLPTLTASCAASAAYASLIVTEFRGFRDFGIIGGAGMMLCWGCTFLFLPSILVVAEKISPLDEKKGGLFGLLPKMGSGGTRFGEPFALIVSKAPRAATVLGIALSLGAAVATYRWVAGDPMEYNLANLRREPTERVEEIRLSTLSNDVTGFVGFDGMAILVERPDQVPHLVRALEARRDAAPAGKKPFSKVHTLQELVPNKQAEKIPLLLSIKKKVLKSHKRGYISDEDFEKIEPFLPPDDVKPFDIDGLPEAMARSFTESDQTRGRVVYISPVEEILPDGRELVEDAHYLFRWADSYRHTKLDDGSVILGSGRAVITADIWEAVISDIPKAVVVSLLVVMIVVAMAFRRGFASVAVVLALLGGIVWMTGLLGVADVRLNFLNFIALPITFGIGVDYAVNVMQRYRREGSGGAVRAVRETGGAVVLCSMTTTLGYLALIKSMNPGVRSLGITAVLGEVACLLAAIIVLPSALLWRDNRELAKRKAERAS
jgi:predicted RND superfamily exporter protein